MKVCLGEHPWICMMNISEFIGSMMFRGVGNIRVIQEHCTQGGNIIETLII